MPKFEFVQYEVHKQVSQIDADTLADAIEAFYNGEATQIDGAIEYCCVDEDRGMSIEEIPEEVENELRSRGVGFDDFLPSIATARELPAEP